MRIGDLRGIGGRVAASVLAFVLSFAALANTSAGLQWLSTQSQADGAIVASGDLATSVQGSSEAIRAALLAGQAGALNIAAAQQFLARTEYSGTEYSARKVLSSAAAPEQLATLLAQQNPDGGWGEFFSYQSNALDTALALEAVIAANQASSAPAARAASYLLAQQASDGGWGLFGNGASEVQVTAAAAEALGFLRAGNPALVPEVARAETFLLSQRRADASWGEQHLTARALLALSKVSADVSSLASTAQALAAQQQANGSWVNDVYTTALALRALQTYAARAGTSSTSGSVTGHVFRSGSREPIADAVVTVPATGAFAQANGAGFFSLAGLPPGSHTLVVQKAGYLPASKAVTAAAGQSNDAGDIFLAVGGATGVLVGKVFDATDQAALAGVTVTLTGPRSASGTTQADGRFDLGALPAGSYSLSFTRNGYSTATASVSVTGGTVLNWQQPLLKQGVFPDNGPLELSGIVRDGTTQAPLAAAELRLDGGSAIVSAADGSFRILGVSRGSHGLQISRAGYQSQTLSLNIPAGASGQLGSVLIYANGDGSPTTLNLLGTIVHGVTGQPIAGATVTLDSTGEVRQSDAAGRFRFDGLSSLSFSLEVSASGYEVRTFQGSASGYGDLAASFPISPGGDPGATSSTYTGFIRDTNTQAGIAGARVQVVGMTASATSDSTGAYSLTGVSQLSFKLDISAAGYAAKQVQVSVTRHGSYQLTETLERLQGQNASFQIVSWLGLQTGTGANSTQTFAAKITNLTSEQQSAVILGEVLDAQNNVIAVLSPYVPNTQTQASSFSFGPSSTLDLIVPWETAQHAAGNYRVRIKVVKPDSISQALPHGVVLNAALTEAVVGPTQSIIGQLTFDPPLLQAGAGQATQITATIINTGNQVLSGTDLSFTLRDPSSNEILLSRQGQLTSLPVGNNVLIDFGAWTPTKVGNLAAKVVASDPAVSGEGIGTLYVGDKATASFTVSPAVVGIGNQAVRGSINLLGVNNATAVSTDPLALPIREAVRKGGEYVAAHAVGWQTANNCLGCHIQTQAILGLTDAARVGIPVDQTAIQTLSNAVIQFQQDDGALPYGSTRDMLGLWSLRSWPHTDRIMRTLYKGSVDLLYWKQTSGNQSWWNDDFCGIWWCHPTAMNAGSMQGLTNVLRRAEEYGESSVEDYYLEQNDNTDLSSISAFEQLPDGRTYFLVSTGVLYVRQPGSQSLQVLASGLVNPSYDMAVRADGTAYVASGSGLIRVAPNGTKTALVSNRFLTGVTLAEDGLPVVTFHYEKIVAKVSDAGQITPLASGSMFNLPYHLVGDGEGGFFISNYGARNILRLKADGNLSVHSAGLLLMPFKIQRAGGGELYIYSGYDPNGYPSGISKIRADGSAEHLANFKYQTYGHPIPPPLPPNEIRNNVNLNPIGFINGKLVLINGDGRIYELKTRQLDMTQGLANIRASFSNVVRWEFARHTVYAGENDYSAVLAWRLITLSEALPYLDDASLVSQAQQLIASISTTLRQRQRADGGWGNHYTGASDSLFTAAIGLALDYTNPSADDPVVRKAITYLLNRQQPDKSWYSETGQFSTRDAVTSFVMVYLPRALERIGGIDTDLTLVTPPDVVLSNPTQAPLSQVTDGEGRTTHHWNFQGVTAAGRNLGFDLALSGLFEDETRPAAAEAYLSFANSFNGETVRSDIQIPGVHAVSDLGLLLATDHPLYVANAPVLVSATVGNAGPPVPSARGHLFVRVAGETDPIADLGPFEVGALATGANATVVAAWNTGLYRPGQYEAYGSLEDSAGNPADTAVTAFTIIADQATATASVTTDKPSYKGIDQVELKGRLRNLSANAAQGASIGELTVVSPANVVVLNESFNLPELTAGALRDSVARLNLNQAIDGHYLVHWVVKDLGTREVVASADTAFDVVSDALQTLEGAVAAQFAHVFPGLPQTCTDTLRNSGTINHTALPVRQLVARLDVETEVSAQDQAMALAAGATQTLTRTLGTAGLAAGDYACILQVKPGDDWHTLAFAPFSVIVEPVHVTETVATDKSVYAIDDQAAITAVAQNQAQYRTERNATLQIRVVSPAGVTVHSEDFALADLAPGASATHSSTYSFTDAVEGTYLVKSYVLSSGGAILANADTDYEVRKSQSQAITGSVSAAQASLTPGEIQTCTDTVSNSSLYAVNGLQIRQVLERTDTPQILNTTPLTINVAANGHNVQTRIFNTNNLEEGSYACTLQANIGNHWTTLGSAGFVVVAPESSIQIDASLSLGGKGRVLVLIDGDSKGGAEPNFAQQKTFIENLLRNNGWSYTLVTDAAGFARELRSGQYSIYAFMSESVKLDGQVAEELREAVYRGEGLLEAGSHDQRNSGFDDALGVKYKGKWSQVSGVEMLGSDLGTPGYSPLLLGEKALRVDLSGATKVGRYLGTNGNGASDAAVTQYTYGAGRSLYFGHDALAEATAAGPSSRHAQLILQGLSYLQSAISTTTQQVVPVTLTLENRGDAVSGRALLTLPAGSTVIDRADATLDSDGKLVWTYSLGEGQSKSVTAWIRLPATAGSYSVTALVQSGVAPNYEDQADASLSLNVQAPAALNEATALSSTSNTYKKVRSALEAAQADIAAQRYANAQSQLIKAANECDKIGAAAQSLRLMIDRALWENGQRL